MKLTTLVTLAGFSRRMGSPKQHMLLNDMSFLETIITSLKSCHGIHKMLFVGQSGDQKSQQTVQESGGHWLINMQPENGPLSSIRLALAETDPDSAIMLWPVDHPMIKSDTVAQLIRFWQSGPEYISIPSDGNRRGHPAIFPAWCREHFFKIDLDQGAKKILQIFPEKIRYLITSDPWPFKNINTPDILAEAVKSLQDN